MEPGSLQEPAEAENGQPEAPPSPAPRQQRTPRRSLLQKYKEWVRSHPGVVSNLDVLAIPLMWNPSRTHNQHSELYYEACRTALGLLQVWHNHILDSEYAPVKRPAAAIWLDAVEQVRSDTARQAFLSLLARPGAMLCLEAYRQHISPSSQARRQQGVGGQSGQKQEAEVCVQVGTLIELRGMFLEHRGQLSRYGPLSVYELIIALLKTVMWTPYPGHLFLRHPLPEDMDQFESEQGLSDVIDAMERLRQRYTSQRPAHAPQAPAPRSTWLGRLRNCFALTQPATQSQPQKGPASAAGAAGGCDGSAAAASATQPRMRFTVSDSGCADTAGAASSGIQGIGVPGSSGVMSVSEQMRMGMDLVWLAEVLHIWRPVVYVTLLHRYGRQSWRPWCISLAIDLLSMHFTYRGKALLRQAAARGEAEASGMSPYPPGPQGQGQGPSTAEGMVGEGWAGRVPAAQGMRVGPYGQTSLLSIAIARGLLQQPWSPGERRELYDRRRKLLFYLLRSPMLDVLLRPFMSGLRSRTQRVPGVGYLVEYAADVLDTLTSYYTYTSCSS